MCHALPIQNVYCYQSYPMYAIESLVLFYMYLFNHAKL